MVKKAGGGVNVKFTEKMQKKNNVKFKQKMKKAKFDEIWEKAKFEEI